MGLKSWTRPNKKISLNNQQTQSRLAPSSFTLCIFRWLRRHFPLSLRPPAWRWTRNLQTPILNRTLSRTQSTTRATTWAPWKSSRTAARGVPSSTRSHAPALSLSSTSPTTTSPTSLSTPSPSQNYVVSTKPPRNSIPSKTSTVPTTATKPTPKSTPIGSDPWSPSPSGGSTP